MLDGGNGQRTVRIDDRLVFVYYAQLSHTGWSMAIVVPMFTMFAWGIVISIVIFVIMLLGMIVVFVVSMLSVHRATKPLKYLTKMADEIANGNFQAQLPVFKRNDEISQLRNSFEAMQESISTYIRELKETTASKASIESELRIAHNIQMAMLPKTFPPFPERNDIDVYGLLNPAKAVGGDLYDFFIRNEKLFFCIGDVSGKGVPASLVMAVTRSLFRNVAIHTSEPERIVTALNDCMSEQNDTNMFVTIFVGVLDLPTGRLRYCNAGHDAPIILDVDGNNVLLPCDANLPIGVMPDWKYSSQHVLVNSGAMIFLYTDGLTEAENSKHELFSMKRVFQELAGIAHLPHEVITQMEDAVHQFVGDAEQSDDLTMMAVHYTRQHVDTILNRQLTLHNDVQEVPELTTFVDEVCQELKIDASTALQLNLAIEEAVVNVMNYAYPTGTKGEVRIEAAANEERLRFVISDDGIPFDPTARGEVDTTLSAEERGIGGLGIHLVRRIMDSINYERINHQNVLTLRKNIK
jgi:sigma-B regulation protein RsbU (phosphoserine phosphatase)